MERRSEPDFKREVFSFRPSSGESKKTLTTTANQKEKERTFGLSWDETRQYWALVLAPYKRQLIKAWGITHRRGKNSWARKEKGVFHKPKVLRQKTDGTGGHGEP